MVKRITRNRKLATPGALLIFGGALLMYWGLRGFGIVGNTQTTTTNVATTGSSKVA